MTRDVTNLIYGHGKVAELVDEAQALVGRVSTWRKVEGRVVREILASRDEVEHLANVCSALAAELDALAKEGR